MDLEWEAGTLTSATVRSVLGNPCVLRTNVVAQIRADGDAVEVDRPEATVVAFDSEEGVAYSLTSDRQVQR